MKAFRQSHGFTLIELSVVLIIIGLIVGMGLMSLVGTMANVRSAITEKRLDVIEAALMKFRQEYNRLPCPGEIALVDTDNDFGEEAPDLGVCTASSPAAWVSSDTFSVMGSIPAVTLDIPVSYMYDGWGRKILYAVDSNATAPDAFKVIPPSANDCRLRVNDASGNPRTTGSYLDGITTGNLVSGVGAIYVLVSFGSNGHGAYIGDSIISSGSTDTAEQTNCKCNAAGALGTITSTFVQKEAVDTGDPSISFDDIVRYKARWHMMNNDDYLTAAKDKAYHLAVGVTDNTTSNQPVLLFKRGCHGLNYGATQYASSAGNTMSVPGLAFSQDDAYLFVHSQSTNVCSSFKINAGTVFDEAAVASCPAYNSSQRVAAATNTDTENTILVTCAHATCNGASSSYMQFFKYSSGAFNPLGIGFASAIAAAPVVTALGKNAKFLFATDQSTYGKVYYYDGSKYDTLTTDIISGAGIAVADLYAAAFSKEGTFFAVGLNGGVNGGDVKVWENTASSDPWGTAVDQSLSLVSDVTSIAFSPDGNYLAVGLDSSSANYSANLKIYKTATGSGSFTAMTVTGSYGEGASKPGLLSFTSDSKSLIVGTQGCCLHILDLVSASEFKEFAPYLNLKDAVGDAQGFSLSQGASAIAVINTNPH